LIGAEEGTLSVHNVKGVDFVSISESSELAAVTEHAAGGSYKTVVLDTASSLQDMILKEILGLEELPAQKSWGMATRDQYGQCGLQTKERLRALLNLTCHVVILAQEREFNTDNNEAGLLTPYVASALMPSVTTWLQPCCDYICQTFLRQKTAVTENKVAGKVVKTVRKMPGVEYCLRTAPDPTSTTKWRLPKGHYLPDVLIDADYDKIMGVINGTFQQIR
jgi:hypothetical protein